MTLRGKTVTLRDKTVILCGETVTLSAGTVPLRGGIVTLPNPGEPAEAAVPTGVRLALTPRGDPLAQREVPAALERRAREPPAQAECRPRAHPHVPRRLGHLAAFGERLEESQRLGQGPAVVGVG